MQLSPNLLISFSMPKNSSWEGKWELPLRFSSNFPCISLSMCLVLLSALRRIVDGSQTPIPYFSNENMCFSIMVGSCASQQIHWKNTGSSLCVHQLSMMDSKMICMSVKVLTGEFNPCYMLCNIFAYFNSMFSFSFYCIISPILYNIALKICFVTLRGG